MTLHNKSMGTLSVCESHVAVYVLQRLPGVGHRQVCVHDEPQAAGRLVVV